MASSASVPVGATGDSASPAGARAGRRGASGEKTASPADPTTGAADGSGTAGRSGRAGREVTQRLSDRALLAVTAVVTLPILWLGYGTDLDIGDVLAAGERIRDLDYAPSRNPGVPVVEAIVAVLDPIGGHVLINLVTALALGVTVVGVARLVAAWGHDNGDLIALAFLASPIVLISGTQTADFVYASAFFTAGALALVRGHPVPAGVLFALTLGSRSSSLLLVTALLVAVAWDAGQRRRAFLAAAIAVPGAALLYVPVWLSYDRSLGFLDATDGWVSLTNNVARFLLKNYAVVGPAALVVLAVAAPALVRSLRNWAIDPMLRFGVLGLLATEALFLRMPWKPAHLVPCLLALVLWIGASSRNRRPFLWVLIGAMALNGLVTFRPFTADDPDTTGGGDFAPAITLGWLANDIRCRIEFMDEPPRLESGAWACALEPMRGPSDGATGDLS